MRIIGAAEILQKNPRGKPQRFRIVSFSDPERASDAFRRRHRELRGAHEQKEFGDVEMPYLRGSAARFALCIRDK